MNLFITQLNADANNPGNMSQYFGLSLLKTLNVEKNIDGKYEGSIEIAVRNAVDAYGKKYSEAVIHKIMEKIGNDRDRRIWDVLNDELFLQQG